MNEGDIYHWRWKSDEKHNDCGPYRAYHCYSRIAVVKDGKLRDTFWHDYKTLSRSDGRKALQEQDAGER